MNLRGTTSGGASSGATITTSLPAGVAANDVIYLWVYGKDASQTFTTPSGYTQISGSPYGSAGEGKAAIFRKVATSSESAPSSTKGNSGDLHRWIITVVVGADTSTPEQDVDFTQSSDYSSNPTAPQSAAGGNDVISLVFVGTGTNGGTISAWPTGWTGVVEEHAGNFVNRAYLGVNVNPGTGTVGSGSLTIATERGQEKVTQVLVKMAKPRPTQSGAQAGGSRNNPSLTLATTPRNGDFGILHLYRETNTVQAVSTWTANGGTVTPVATRSGTQTGSSADIQEDVAVVLFDGTSAVVGANYSTAVYTEFSCVVVRNPIGALAVDVLAAATTANGSSTTALAIAQVTTTAADALLVALYSAFSGATWTPPTGMVEFQDTGVFGAATELRPTAGATGTRTATRSANSWSIGLLLALAAASSSTPQTGSDSGTATDSATLARSSSTTDTGAGADSAAGTAAASLTDAASGADAAALARSSSTTDTGAGTEAAAALTQGYVGTDSGVGADAHTATAAELSRTDAGTGADAAALGQEYSGSDTGSGADAATLTQGPTATDAGTGTDAAGLDLASSTTDSAAVSEATALSQASDGSDSATGADSGVLARQSALADSGTVGETAAIDAALSRTDSATGADAAVLDDEEDNDPVFGVDDASMGEAASIGVVGSFADAGASAHLALVTAQLGRTDDGSMLDASTHTAASSRVDSGAVLDTALLGVVLAGVDAGSLAEQLAIGGALSRTDVGSMLDLAVPPISPVDAPAEVVGAVTRIDHARAGTVTLVTTRAKAEGAERHG